jgi:putative glutamine amidotransferase
MDPVILLTPKFSSDPESGQDQLVRLKESYFQAVTLAGGIPVLAGNADPKGYVQLADGLLLTGGIDLDPARYGQAVLSETVTCDSRLDELESGLYRAFFTAGKPIFGICRGIQLINVTAGGTLWQDLKTQCPGLRDHRRPHQVQLDAASELAALFGSVIEANSSHHQAVRHLAPGFHAIAWSEDGVIEAITHETRIIEAVQWHPERMLGRPGLTDMLPLFQRWLALCAADGTRKDNRSC